MEDYTFKWNSSSWVKCLRLMDIEIHWDLVILHSRKGNELPLGFSYSALRHNLNPTPLPWSAFVGITWLGAVRRDPFKRTFCRFEWMDTPLGLSPGKSTSNWNIYTSKRVMWLWECVNLTPSSVLVCRSIYLRPCKHYIYIEIRIMDMQPHAYMIYNIPP